MHGLQLNEPYLAQLKNSVCWIWTTLPFTCHERNISFATTASDNAVAHATWYLSSFKPLVLANFLFCLRDINLTLGLLPLRGHVVWRDSVGVESSRIFFTRVLSGCYVILTSPKEGETAVYGIAVFCLQNLICLLFIFADQVFIDPTFFGIFVCGPLQSFVVNV